MSLLDLEATQTISVQVTNNVVSGNTASSPDESGGAGGLALEVYSRRSVAPGATFVVEENTIRGNTAELDGGGAEIYLTAESENLNDPNDTRIAPAFATLDFRNNLIVLNSSTNASFQDGVGGGILAFLQSFGGEPGPGGDDSKATINFELNTVADNSSDTASGGIELESYTGFDSGGSEGLAEFNVNSSIVSDNTGFGLGGPGATDSGVFTPGVGGDPPHTNNFLIDVAYSDVFANDVNYEAASIGDRTGIQENISADPLLDSVTYVPQICSPTLDGADPLLDFSLEPDPDGGRANMGHTGGTSLAAASLADPNGDNIVDGIDVLRIAVAFGSMFGQPRWDETADLDGSGLVDGTDLAFLAAGFGDVCP